MNQGLLNITTVTIRFCCLIQIVEFRELVSLTSAANEQSCLPKQEFIGTYWCQ